MYPSLALHVITGQVVKDIDIGSTCHTCRNGAWNGIYDNLNASEKTMNTDIMLLYFWKFTIPVLVVDDITVMGLIEQDVNQLANNSDLFGGNAYSLCSGGIIYDM